jgi:hypothetical protein
MHTDICIFLQFAKHWIIKLSGHQSKCHMSSPHITSIFFNPTLETLNNILCELHGSQWNANCQHYWIDMGEWTHVDERN